MIARVDIDGDYLNQKRSHVKACVGKFSRDQAKSANSMAQSDGVSTFPDMNSSPNVNVSTLEAGLECPP